MAACFHPSVKPDEDSAILFSTSNSPEGSTSPSSSNYHSSPQQIRFSSDTPFYDLTVRKLSYTIPHKKLPPVKILDSVSFTAKSSELLAIVGASGTGKSTLLRIMSGRVNQFDPNSILLNNHPMNRPNEMKKICGFVAQEDSLLPLLTVKETLMFSAKFRLRGMSLRDKELRVESMIHELGLVHVADSYVGDEDNRGVSGGERKRLSIGVDMVHDPAILLLDEPTSGLDSTSALQVVEMLSTMAKMKQRTIVFSIHQPSYRILQYISTFVILSGGSVVHNGSLSLLEERITRLGFKIPMQLNPLEFAMEIMPVLQNSDDKDKPSDGEEYPSSYDLHPEDEEEEELHEISQEQHPQHQQEHDSAGSYYWSFLEIIYLCLRFWKIMYRTKQLFLARTMQAVVGGFGLASVYINVRKDEGGVSERLGLFAFSLSFLLSSTVEALPIYLQERRVIMKEVSRGSYTVSSYMIANTIVFVPFLLAVSVLFSVPLYWLVGLNPSVAAFTFFLFVVWLIVLMASSLVLFLSSISPDFISGNSLICTVLGAFFLFSGYFIPKESIPNYWIFMYYISLYRYPLDALLTNEYWSAKSECFSWKTDEQGVPKCALTGYDVLKSRGLDKDTRWINVGIMFGFFIFYRVLCWVILARRTSKTTI